MNYNKQIKHLWGIPSYRLRLLFFVVLGTTAILASLLIQNAYWQDLLSNFAVTFAAVGVIDFMWDIVGGEPLEAKMTDSFAEMNQQIDALNRSVNQRIDVLNRSLSTVADLTNFHIGMERIWPTRDEWRDDKKDGKKIWIERICQAKEVDIVSNTFDSWSKNEDFVNELRKAMNKGTKVRLLIYDPESEILVLRAKHERESKKPDVSRMKAEIKLTLERLASIREKLDANAKDNLKIRLTQGYYHLFQIIRADDRIIITIYLLGKTGSPSPVFQVLEPSEFFTLYKKQFETLWEGYLDQQGKTEKLTVRELTEEDYQRYCA